VSATISAATGELVVVFDQPLLAGVVDPSNWSASANVGAGQKTHTGMAAAAAGSSVTVQTVSGGLSFPPNAVFFAASPADVVSAGGSPAAPFVDLPLSVV